MGLNPSVGCFACLLDCFCVGALVDAKGFVVSEAIEISNLQSTQCLKKRQVIVRYHSMGTASMIQALTLSQLSFTLLRAIVSEWLPYMR